MEVFQFQRTPPFTCWSALNFVLLTYSLISFSMEIGAADDRDPINCKTIWKDGGVLEGEEKSNAIYDKCLEMTKFDESKFIGLAPNTTLEDFDIDDNCFVQCGYKGDGLLSSDDSIDKTKTAMIFKGNLTEEVLNKAKSVWDGCIDDAEKIASKKSFNKCKMATLHDFCFTQRALIEAQLFSVTCD